LKDELGVVAEAAGHHLGIGLGLELEVAVVDLAVLLQLEHAVDAALDGLDLDGACAAHARTLVAGEWEQVLRILPEEELERPVGLHGGSISWRMDSEGPLRGDAWGFRSARPDRRGAGPS
jgi:hypothetical protein